MMEKQKTPIALAIQEIKEEANFITKQDSKEDRYYARGMKRTIEILESLKPKEREMFENTYKGAERDMHNAFSNDFHKRTSLKDYFDTNLTQE